MPRSNSGQKVILWAFCCRSSNFAALVRPLRARARAGDRPGHTILAEYLCPTEPGSAETAPVLRGFPRKTITRQNSNYRRPPGRFVSPGRFCHNQCPGQAGAHHWVAREHSYERGRDKARQFLRGLPRKTITRLSAYQNFTPGHWRSLHRQLSVRAASHRYRRQQLACGLRMHRSL